MPYLPHQLGELALGSRLRLLSDRLMQDVTRAYRHYRLDFESRWFLVFYQLSITDGLGITEVADRIGLTHAAVNQIANAMQKAGLVRSTSDQRDGRRRILCLTPKAKHMLPALKLAWEDIEAANRELLQSLSGDLLNVLDQYEQAIDQRPFADRILQRLKNRQLSAVEILTFHPSLSRHFKSLNEEWLRKYFSIEPHDREMLSDPQRMIVKPGGMVFFARANGKIVGTCAVIRHSVKLFELGKMAVTEKAQGLQIGKKLGLAAVEFARRQNAEVLYLETNRRLKPAIELYKRLGFEFVPFFKTDYARSNVRMELHLKRVSTPIE